MVVSHLNPALKRYGSGVVDPSGRFYPFKSVSVAAAGTVLAARENVRYFVAEVTLAWAAVAGDAGTSITVTATVDRESNTLAQCLHTASTAIAQFSQAFRCNVLTDRNTAITLTAANITTAGATVVYARVDDVG